jgi:hypothetical protein
MGASGTLPSPASIRAQAKIAQHQQAEALRRLAGRERFRFIARSYRVSHTTVSRLAGA